MCEKFFVVSDDGVLPRIILQDTSETVCHKEADRHWMEDASADELMYVVCNHDYIVSAAQVVATC